MSRALGVMTNQILKHGGVTGDFQGDAAMGFWGWPFASPESPIAACRAALGIRAAFRETFGRVDHPLGSFQVGIGVAHGRAVAGKIGTSEQVKVTVFGPVVNLASRLEGMTKQLRVPIVLDEATAAIVSARMDHKEGRTRRLARVLPYGTETPVLVSELLPSAARRAAADRRTVGDLRSGGRSLHRGALGRGVPLAALDAGRRPGAGFSERVDCPAQPRAAGRLGRVGAAGE